ncbi:PAS domain-containing protein [Candidatus Electrothrix marina]|uniref:PAS domain-containing protein n=1 Tax=Candidatus Electrothrix marina TaxID=1859130 RepID=A0A444JG41_9BACT|nr:PAS domain-containing protein [Candidatus Electrothrix marina]
MKEKYMLREVFDALPSMVFVVDQDVRIQEYNAAAEELMRSGRNTILQQRAGEILHCIHSKKAPKGCGKSPKCSDCIIRNSVTQALQGKRVVRRRTRMEIMQNDHKTEIYALVTVSQFSFRGSPHALLVIEEINEIAELYNMIFICPVCGKVQDDKKVWMQVEAYFKNNWNVECSHGYCPDCFKKEMKKIKFSSKNRNDLPIID